MIYATHQHGPHIHLVCRQCGQVIDADQNLLLSLNEQLNTGYQFAADLHHISVPGLCSDCQSKQGVIEGGLICCSSPSAMHIPDGFLSVQVSMLIWLVAIIVVGYALKRVGADLGERQVPLMGVLAAAIFAGQMLNFAVAGGTSGHLIGAAIATILLGPWAAMLVFTCVISIQALIFQDGGLLVLGANIVNMAI